MTAPRIGSLFTGTGALDLAVQAVFGGEMAWHCQYDPEDKHQFAAHLLAHRWPGVPNLGDISQVDFTAVEPVDILTGGFPCTDLSLAGKRAGLHEGTRSGLWLHMARAIAELRPSIVVIENVRGLLSAPAHSNVEPCPWCLGDTECEPPLRALGVVLADLAELGLDAEWVGLPASSIGAPHERWREFLLAWPADAARPGLEDGREGRAARLGPVAADADRSGGHGPRACGAGRDEPADDGEPAADAAGVGHGDAGPQGVGGVPAAAVAGGSSAAADAGRVGLESGQYDVQPGQPDAEGRTVADADGRRREGNQERDRGPEEGQPEREPGLDAVGRGVRGEGVGCGTAPDAARDGRREGGAESAGLGGGSDASVGSGANWGQFEPAIRRWEQLLGQSAPRPVDDRGRLNPELPEWMMGLPAGHITAVPPVPGMTAAQLRNAQLKAAGNGVVPQQAEAALRLLLARATPASAAA